MPFLKNPFKSHTPLFFLIPYAAFMIFTGLGDSALQVDEGSDTFVSTTLLKYGLPRHSDGVNHVMDFADVYDGLFVYRTWFPYYLQAASIFLFGKTALAARLPFAIAGFLSVCFLYLLTFKLTGKKSIAFLASLFLASSVPTLILFRTARYFSLPVLFAILMLYSYLTLYDEKKWRPFPFIAAAFLFFHSMYVELVSISLGIVFHLIHSRDRVPKENLKKIVFSFIIIGIITAPWIAFISPVFSRVYEYFRAASELVDNSAWKYPKHLLSLLFQLNSYIFPFLLALVLFLKPAKALRPQVHLPLSCIVSVIVVATLHPVPSQFYITACFPPLFILLAILVVEGAPYGPKIRAPLVLTLIATNILHVGPLMPIKPFFEKNAAWFEKSIYLEGVQGTFVREVKLSAILYNYLYEITHPYSGPLDAVVEFFKTHGKTGETCYISNESASLAYHTGMKLIHKNEITSKSRPDWIVLRDGNVSLEGDSPPRSAVEARLRKVVRSGTYKKFVLASPVDRINNAYEIQIHRFEPLAMGEITIYHLEKDEFSNFLQRPQ